MAEFLASDGVTIHYEVEGTQYGPPLVFSNSLGTNLHMWDGQAGEATELRLPRHPLRPARPWAIGGAGGELFACAAGR